MVERILGYFVVSIITSWERNSKAVRGGLPAFRPALAAFPGGVETHDGHVHALQSGLLVREMASGLDGLADAGVDALYGV